MMEIFRQHTPSSMPRRSRAGRARCMVRFPPDEEDEGPQGIGDVDDDFDIVDVDDIVRGACGGRRPVVASEWA